MNGSDHNYQPNPELPPPSQEGFKKTVPEQMPTLPMQAEVASKKVEQQPAASPGSPSIPAMPIGAAPIASPPMPAAPGPAPATRIPVNDSPAVADDGDLIEKEWVNKAKFIVETTRIDPHRQNKELSKFKADYIQKRYNKQLKVSED